MATFSEIPNVTSFECQAMACEFVFHLQGEDLKAMRQASREASEYLDKLENLLSLYVESSDVTRINRAREGDSVRISPETLECLLMAFQASALFDGKYHPFLGWESLQAKGQLGSFSHLPSTSDTLAELSEDPVIALDRDASVAQKLRAGPLLDLGGIGKGFALDRLAKIFGEWGIGRAVLESAGSAYLSIGSPEDLAGWSLGIGCGDATGTITLPEGSALASSGFVFNENHIIDPDGKKGDALWARSYAFASDAALADAASTAAILMNSDALNETVSNDSALSFIVYDSSGISHEFGDWP